MDDAAAPARSWKVSLGVSRKQLHLPSGTHAKDNHFYIMGKSTMNGDFPIFSIVMLVYWRVLGKLPLGDFLASGPVIADLPMNILEITNLNR